MLLCKEDSRNGVVSGSVPVYLNVYDIYWFGLGIHHSGVEVHDVEYGFGAQRGASSGIYSGKPKKCEGFRYRETILIGNTDKNIDEVRNLMIELAAEYKGNAYNLITKNCNHFCHDVCVRLTGNSIPSWVNRLATIISKCFLPL